MLEILSRLLLSIDLFATGIRLGTPLMCAGVGEIASERAGVVNVGLEGMMLCGAFGGALGAYATGSPWIGLLAAVAAGLLAAALQAFFSVLLAVDQVIVGIGLNAGSLGVTTYAARVVFGMEKPQLAGFAPIQLPGLTDLPIVGSLFAQSVPAYLVYLLVPVATFILLRTRWGLALRAVGEHPEAAASAGISVARTRCAAVLLCGALAGLAGSFFSLVQLNTFVEAMIGGRGFIVLAVVIVGRWSPWRAALAALLFGALDAVALRAQALSVGLPYQLLLALPYLTTLAAYWLSGRAGAPAALGRAFVRD
jgi:ABC-type uncharacterized transport system permease subunit